jgi:hypothetical protein
MNNNELLRFFSLLHYFLFFSLLLLFLISACTKAEKQPDSGERGQESVEFYYPNSEKDKSNIEYVNRFAIINEDDIPVYFTVNFDISFIGFLHKGNVVKVLKKMEFETKDTDNIKNIYYVNVICYDSFKYLEGWVYDKYLSFIQIPQTKTTMLTNSKNIDIKYFSKIDHYGIIATDYDDPSPRYLDDTGDWVIYDDSMESFGLYGISMHLRNLPWQFIVLVYTEDEKNYLKYLANRNEYDVKRYKDDYDDETNSILDRIKPIYTFHFPAQASSISSKRKVEIHPANNVEGDVIYSTDITFPSMPIKRTNIDETNIYFQFSTEYPLYFVLYKDSMFDKDDEKYGKITVNEGVPVNVFAIYPKDNNWEGILSLGSEFDINSDYFFRIYRFNYKNPNDYLRVISNYWATYVYFKK